MSKKGYILLTGGLGYIGSRVSVELLEEGYKIIIIDNLSNSKLITLDNIKKIIKSKKNNQYDIIFYEIDICNSNKLNDIFSKYTIDYVIHMAGLKAVSESIDNPLKYYDNNMIGTLNLLNIMNKFHCYKLIFSSSATIYGNQKYPVDESAITGFGITNPYGKTKHMIEEILKDLYKSNNSWQIVILRYFNPVGSHISGLLKENPKSIPTNLFPYIVRVSEGIYPKLGVYGNDYDTIDGTCVRDFIHVVDLAKGHIAPIKKISDLGLYIYNLGTGKGTSVLELIKKFNEVNKLEVSYYFTDRRHGDLQEVYACVDKIYKELNWKTEKTLEDICKLT